jgi:hypothetical protein
MGLSDWEFWYLSHEEFTAKADCWDRRRDFESSMYYQIRADIYNSAEHRQREDKRLWTAQDFGADEPSPSKQAPQSEETIRAYKRTQVIMQFGAGTNGSVLKGLKGQSIPASVQGRIEAGKSASKASSRRTRNLRRASVK